MEEARHEILALFKTNRQTYDVIFTSGCTAALKLLGMAFPWSKESMFCHLVDNHTSGIYSSTTNTICGTFNSSTWLCRLAVVGIREFALSAGASLSVVDPHLNELFSSALDVPPSSSPLAYNLFAFPAESNFSGCLYNLNLIRDVRNGLLERTRYEIC